MSRYIQIQTYTTCDETTFSTVLQTGCKMLKQLGCTDQRVLDWLAEFRRATVDEKDFGDIFASPFLLRPLHTKTLQCAGLSVSLYTRSGAPSMDVEPIWLGFDLLFDMKTVKDHAISTYKVGVGQVLWYIMGQLATAFQELGVYLTDEWQNNLAWRALVEGAGDPWMFDLAVFPRKLAEQFQSVPAGFQGTVTEQGFGFAQANRWQTLPWLEEEA